MILFVPSYPRHGYRWVLRPKDIWLVSSGIVQATSNWQSSVRAKTHESVEKVEVEDDT
jgi:hypothetical protein